MSLLGKLVDGTVNWATSGIRVVYHGARVAVNGIQVVGDLASGDKASLDRNLRDLKDAGAGMALAGVQTATGPVGGILLGAVEGDIRKIVKE